MLICLIGPSAVGKTTLENKLEELNIASKLISTTDRVKRPNEPDGAYHFVSKEDFNKIELSESTEYAGNRYGLSMDELHRTNDETKDFVFVCEINGAKQMCDFVKIPMVMIFLDAPDEHLHRRLHERGTNDIMTRIKRIPEDRLSSSYCHHIVLNHDYQLDKTVEQIKKIIVQHKEGVSI